MDFRRYEYDNDGQELHVLWEDETYTLSYRTANGEYVYVARPPKKQKEPELQTGDSSALDAFLGGFAGAKK